MFWASNYINDLIARNRTGIAYDDFGPRQEESSQTVRWSCARLEYPGEGTPVHAR
jgi:hypothetical protein